MFNKGDFIKLEHSESLGYLTADINYTNNYPECYIRKYTGKEPLEMNSVASIWKIEIEK